MELFLTRTLSGFSPTHEPDMEALKKFKLGDTVRAEVVRPRNLKFHRKFFALLNVAFEAWETPTTEFRGLPVQKNFKRFRKDCIIAAGFYDPVHNLKGEVRAEAHSIAFGNMSEDEFEKLYSAVADVILQQVLRNYTRGDLDAVVAEVMGFT